MNDRRRFLHVLGATTAAVALPACGGSDSTTGTTGAGGAGGGAGGAGGAGGGGTSSVTSSTSSSTSSTGTGGSCVDTVEGIAIGAPSDFAAEGLHLVPGSKVLIGRDAMGLYALTSVCTHELCDMDEKQGGKNIGIISAKGIVCNCHGSQYDNFGAVVKGPANKPLKAYALALCEGKLYVDKTTQVPVTTRLDA